MRAYDVAGINRLRFVFKDTVLSVGLAADATFADIAEALGNLPRTARPGPIAIDVTVAQQSSRFYRSPLSSGQRRQRMEAADRHF